MNNSDMTACQLIGRIADECDHEKTPLVDIRNALEDGEALARLGVTDSAQGVAEDAHAMLTSWIRSDLVTLAQVSVTPRHSSGKDDARYTVRPEFCGQGSSKFVARFCGEWVGVAETTEHAWQLCNAHHAREQLRIVRGEQRLDDYRQAYGRQHRKLEV